MLKNKLAKYTGSNDVTSYQPNSILAPFGSRSIFELDNWVDSLFNEFWREPSFLRERNWRYSEFSEDENNYTVTVELPGFSKEQVKITTKGNALNISAKNDKSNYSRTYSGYDWDLSRVESKLENGVLSVKVAKTEQAKEKVIEIK